MPRPREDVDRILASSASGTSFLIIIQLSSRLFTFIANQLILRSLSPATLGIAAQLELYFISILYFSRESIRTAIQRQPLVSTSKANSNVGASPSKPCRAPAEDTGGRRIASQSVVNMSYLSIGMGIPLSMAFAASYTRLASEEVSQAPFYRLSVAVTTVATLLELLTEPLFAIVQQYMLYKNRAAVEMGAALIKSLSVCTLFFWASWSGYNIGVLPFALGYLCHSLTLIGGYYLVASKVTKEHKFSLLLTKIPSSEMSALVGHLFPRPLIQISTNVFFQSIVKHLLTQGDAMILAAMTTLEDQGAYALASNYGGLVARILFQPIEESSRTMFASLFNSARSTKQKMENLTAAKAHLGDILWAYAILSALVVPLGPYLVPQVFHMLGGDRWASADVDGLLSLYCYYIPFLAFNGISEAFVSSAASPSDLRRQAGWMGAFSGCFAVAAFLFLQVGQLGARGLVYANIVNMAVRTAWSFSFIKSYFSGNGTTIKMTDFGLRSSTYILGAIMSAMLARKRGPNTSFQTLLKDVAISAIYGLTL
ncbi:Rft protein-domain-containing protein [Aspergillus ambiguus]|uniref:putative nuclear division Rft1 protein n=1 Tax=Aspergillus ambiguus TaxID=176160 RepID=UPI003CCD52EF